MVGFAKLVVQTVAVVPDGTETIDPHWITILATLGVAFEHNPVNASCLLCKRQQMRFAIRGVIPVIPGASVDTKSRHIRSS